MSLIPSQEIFESLDPVRRREPKYEAAVVGIDRESYKFSKDDSRGRLVDAHPERIFSRNIE